MAAPESLRRGLWTRLASMPDAPERRTSDELAQQWQLLAERRRQHLLALYRSGRWRKYYSEEQMMAQMRELVRAINAWGECAHANAPAARSETPDSPDFPAQNAR